MDLAWLSLAALLVVIVVSCTTRVNAGTLAMTLAWVIGLYVAPAWGQPVSIRELMTGFPIDLFLTLAGVTLLFSLASVNGTLERLARLAVRGCRGDRGLIPLMFFVLSLVLSSIGAGNIAGTALVAPLALVIARRAAISPFLMSIMVAHGAIAGGLSPFSPTGIIADRLMHEKLALSGFEGRLYAYNLAVNAVVALGGYVIFGGWKLFGQAFRDDETPAAGEREPAAGPGDQPAAAAGASRFSWQQCVTLGVIAALITGVIVFRVHVGMAAFAGAVLLTLVGAADERQAVQRIPWGVILMVCGVTMLTALLERTGGLDRFALLVSQVSSPSSVTGVIALLTGIISVYSSTSGVVLPAFLPMVPKLIDQLGGGDPFAISCSVIVGGHLVDSSPLSTIGALCLASAPLVENRRTLFNQLLAWGLSMAAVGAVVCWLLFGRLSVAS